MLRPGRPVFWLSLIPAPGYWRLVWRRLSHDPLAIASGGVIVGFILVALFAGILATHDPYEQFLRAGETSVADPLAPRDNGKFEPPSTAHWFGTDELARDIFSRTLYGLRISLGAALVAMVLVVGMGLTVGTCAVMGPKWVDGLLMRATDIAYAFPDLLLIILFRAAFGNTFFGIEAVGDVNAGVLMLFLAISLTAWPTMARLVRGQLLVVRGTDYAMSAVAIGASPSRIALRHWLPNAMGPVLVEATFLVPRAIFAEAALSYIGLGVPPPVPSLGSLIEAHFGFVTLQWTALAIPTVILAVLFVAFQLFGDALREAMDPRSSGA